MYDDTEHRPEDQQESIRFTPPAWGDPGSYAGLFGGNLDPFHARAGTALVMAMMDQRTADMLGCGAPQTFESVGERLARMQNVGAITGIQTAKRCCRKEAHDGVWLNSWNADHMADLPAATDPGFVPVMLTVFDAHNGGRQATAMLDVEDLKQLINRAQAIVTAAESAAGRV